MAIAERDKSFENIRGQVARVLLDHAGDNTNGRNRLTHRDMAEMLDTDWDKVHLSLKSLHELGAITIDRNRLIIKTDTLQKVAGNGEHLGR